MKPDSTIDLKVLGAFLESSAGLKPLESEALSRFRSGVLRRLCREHSCSSTNELIRLLVSDPDGPIARELLSHVVVPETSFFRHLPQLRLLENQILPAMIRERRGTTRRLTVWSAGCSTGEEAYSVAILICRALRELSGWRVRIIGTDMSESSLAIAREARYTTWSFRSTPASYVHSYFRPVGDHLEVADLPRHLVQFTRHNLATGSFPPPPFAGVPVDLIVCRNVLLYLSRAMVSRLIVGFAAALAPDGRVLCGPSETGLVAAAGGLVPDPVGHAIYSKKSFETARHAQSRVNHQRSDTAPELVTAFEPSAPAEVTAEFWVSSGMDLHERGQLEEAVTAFQSAIFLRWDLAIAHYYLGRAFLELRNVARARGCFSTARSLLERLPAVEPVPLANGLLCGTLRERMASVLQPFGDSPADSTFRRPDRKVR